MKESDFQALYETYHNSSQPLKRNKIIEELHYYVYQYAYRRFGAEKDMASDFYMKMYDRIEKLLKEYDPKYNISFLVYLSVILKKNYFKFLSVKTEKENIYQDFYDWDSEVPANVTDHPHDQEMENESKVKKSIVEAMSFLNIDKHMTLRLNFGFYLLLAHLRELIRRHGGLHFFPIYREYVIRVQSWEREEGQHKEALLEKTQVIYHKSQQQALNQKKENRRQQLIEDFYKIKSPVPLKLISKLVKKSISQVHRLIKSAKDELKRIFIEKYGEISKSLGIT